MKQIIMALSVGIMTLLLSCKSADGQLIEAARNRDKDAARDALKKGANVNFLLQNQDDALIIAIEENDLEMVKLLVENGSDINSLSGGRIITPIHQATYYDRLDIMRFLLDKGADVNIAHSQYGTTPIFSVKSMDALKLLLAKKANVNAKDNQGQNPLFHLTSRPDFIQLLLGQKADKNAKDKNQRKPLSAVNTEKAFRDLDENEARSFILLGGNLNEIRHIYPTTGTADYAKNLCVTYYSTLGYVTATNGGQERIEFLKKLGAKKDPRDGTKQKCPAVRAK